jgi:hypothetical protein
MNMDENVYVVEEMKQNIENTLTVPVSTVSGNQTFKCNTTVDCKFCKKSISKANIRRHENQCSKKADNNKQRFQCKHCSKSFSRKDNLKTHALIHDKCEGPRYRFMNCSFDKCHQTFNHKTTLIEHLKCQHQCDVQNPQVMNFSNIVEFETWKGEEEERTYSYFSKQCGNKVSGENEFIYFYCQHDSPNVQENRSKRKTSRKQHIGQIKSGRRCISMIRLKIKNSGECEVKYFPTHSHPLSIQDWKFQPQSKSTYQFIDQQISLNVSPTKIAQTMKQPMSNEDRDDTDNTKLTKANLISRNLIRLRALKKRKSQRYHEDDATSVYLMAEAMKIEDPNKVIIYKPLGQNCVVGPAEVNNLPDANKLFMFGFQTKAQRELMIKENTILIIDETHGTNQYGYRLLTCLIRDDNNSGWPVAHLITSRSDADTLQYFFKSLKEKCPEMTVNCVITDDDGALINAVKLGFEESEIKHILCKWHLHKSWKGKLRELVSKELSEEMYLGLILISETKNLDEFKNLSDAFMKKYVHLAPKFCQYFHKEYLISEERIKKWASCYRNFYHGHVNTTGHVESFHNRLKTVYLKRKPNKRIDDLIQILLGIENEDYWRRKRRSTFGVNLSVNERHSKGLKIPDSFVTIEDKQCIVKSSSTDGSNYIVTKIKDHCFDDFCFFKCTVSSCHNLCSHLFICTCPDINNLCKHIHKVQSLLCRNLSSDDCDKDIHLFTSSEPPVASKANVKLCEEKLQQLLSLVQSEKLPHELVSNISSNIDDLLNKCKAFDKIEYQPSIEKMNKSITYSSKEKLKTQAAQLTKFVKRKRKVEKNTNTLISPSKKLKLKRDLLSLLGETTS